MRANRQTIEAIAQAEREGRVIDYRRQTPKPAKPSKYRSRKTTVNGITFDSAKEAREWQKLLALQASGAIQNLRRQHPFRLVVNGMLVCRFVSDFSYVERGRLVVADCKSSFTRKNRAYRIKHKLMKALLAIEVVEIL